MDLPHCKQFRPTQNVSYPFLVLLPCPPLLGFSTSLFFVRKFLGFYFFFLFQGILGSGKGRKSLICLPFFLGFFVRKILAPIKTKSELLFMGMGFSCRKNTIFPGAHKIGAAISGPRIAGRSFYGHEGIFERKSIFQSFLRFFFWSSEGETLPPKFGGNPSAHQSVVEMLSQRALRGNSMPRGKNCRETIFAARIDNVLTAPRSQRYGCDCECEF